MSIKLERFSMFGHKRSDPRISQASDGLGCRAEASLKPASSLG